MTGARSFWLSALLGLGFHGVLLVDSLDRTSPGWDEVVYPAAGLHQWRTRTAGLGPEHPALGRLWVSWPLLFTDAALPYDHPSWEGGDSFTFGHRFLYHNNVPPSRLIELSRWPNVLLSMAAGLLLGLWARRWGGAAAGAFAMAAYAVTPLFLSRGGTALLDTPAAFGAALALCVHGRLWRSPDPRLGLLTGAAIGAALSAKMTGAPVALGLALHVLCFGPASFAGRCGRVAAMALGAAASYLAIGFLFSSGWREALHPFTWAFISEWSGDSFFNDQLLAQTPAAYSWLFLAAKTSPWLAAAALAGAWAAARRPEARPDAAAAWLVAAVALSMPFFARVPFSTVQFIAAFVACAALAGGLALAPKGGRIAGGALLAAAALEALLVHPNPMAYVSPFFGGMRQGVSWVSDSDGDWGQGIPLLTEEWERRGRPSLLLAYSGAADPEAHGLSYMDVYSPALVSRERTNTLLPEEASPLFLAVGAKLFQAHPLLFNWLRQNRAPAAVLKGVVFVYDISDDVEAAEWLEALCRSRRRGAESAWAGRRAALLSKRRALPPSVGIH